MSEPKLYNPEDTQMVRDLKTEVERLREQVCDSCSPDDYGWNYNAVEGRVPCTCISESGAYGELQDRFNRLLERLNALIADLDQMFPEAASTSREGWDIVCGVRRNLEAIAEVKTYNKSPPEEEG